MHSDDRRFMEMAVAEAAKCVSEDGQVRPKVGVVIATNGQVLAQAHRGELAAGEHAEFTALERKPSAPGSFAGSTVYATLEPCTTRNHPKVPCAHRLVEHRVARVVVGMLDPNPNILGRGILALREAGISVEFFPADLMAQLEAMNRDFKRLHGVGLAPPITEELLAVLRDQSLDDWYVALNRTYWNRNFQRDAGAIFSHLVEVLGTLSVLVSKKKVKGAPVRRTVAKALAWWLALCGKMRISSVSEMLWGKFPLVCPYCQQEVHEPTECTQRKKAARGPDWKRLNAIGVTNKPRMPKTIAQWQRMFATIYPPSAMDDMSKTFAKLTEEIGELAEAVRVFPAAPGYFLSEASDVFAWLMKISNLDDEDAETPPSGRGDGLQDEFASAYPRRCVDCNSAICNCPPILGTTVGRIAHEVRADGGDGSSMFLTAASASARFGPPK